MENWTLGILGSIVAIVSGVVFLAVLGFIDQSKQRKANRKFNRQSIESFMNGHKNKKYSRQSTPKVPTIKK
jgi:hypothetical protein